jgi:hypothetical protein
MLPLKRSNLRISFLTNQPMLRILILEGSISFLSKRDNLPARFLNFFSSEFTFDSPSGFIPYGVPSLGVGVNRMNNKLIE